MPGGGRDEEHVESFWTESREPPLLPLASVLTWSSDCTQKQTFWQQAGVAAC